MLSIYTDQKDTAWLNYILEEFIRIQKAQFGFEIQPLNDFNNKSNGITYAGSPLNSCSIPNLSSTPVQSDLKFISEEFYVLDSTFTSNEGFNVKYDLFWNAFVFLSRKEEFDAANKGHFIHSYATKHPRKGDQGFSVPIVNLLFNKLESLITKHFPNLEFGSKSNPVIELSHDLDYIKKTWQLKAKQTVFNSYNTLKSILTPKHFGSNFTKTVQFLFSGSEYWFFDYWHDLESSHSLTSTFYIYSKSGKKNIKASLIDPSYDIAKNRKLQDELKQLMEKGHKIGIHGSYYSFVNMDLFEMEKINLEKSIGTEIKCGRQHWLRYNEILTPPIHDRFLEFDSTIGWNDQMGFRSGILSAYRPYDHINNQPFGYFIIPQIIMDSHIFDYAGTGHLKQVDKGKRLLSMLNDFKSPHVSISWHPRTRGRDYNWHLVYEQYLDYIPKL